jgi:16S rRNA G1207 methylase RsmC
LFENAKLVMHDAEYGVVSCVRSQAQPDKKGKELKKWRDKKTLDLAPAVVGSSAAKKTTSLPWTSYPGLFAGGGLDVMTSLLLRRLLPTLDRKAKLKALDYCSGNGVVAAGIQLAAKKTKLTLLDADAIALDAAKKNLPRGESTASFILSDAWTRVDPSETYNLIVSNPPVHHGLAVDFHPTRALLQSLPVRLDETSGVAYIVTQRYVPFRAIASSVVSPSSAVSIACEHADARFVVWTCRRRAR